MFNPESRPIGFWQLIVIIAALFSAVLIPVTIVYGMESRSWTDIVNWLITLVFTLDVLVHFNTSFMRHGIVISDRRQLAMSYLKGFFAIDVIAALPIGNILPLLGIAAITPFIARLLFLNRLFKLFRVNLYIKKIAGRMNPAILRLFMLVFWILMAAHFISCFWMYIYGNPDGLGPRGRYIQAFYWTITTLTTIGYGDITPTGSGQMLFVILIELIGAAMYGLIIGNIANLIANIDIAKTQHKEKMEKINTFMNYRNLPGSLKRKINNYYEYLWASRRGYDEASVLQGLPDPLKVSVALYLNKEIIEKVPIFEGASDEFMREIIMNLTPVVYTPGDAIVKAGEVGYDMFFISKGSLDVLSADEETLYNTLSAGQFFGEIALLLSMPRTATIRARDYCDLYRLDKATFDRVLSRYPDFAASINKLARERKARIEAISNEKEKTGKKNKEIKKHNEPAEDVQNIEPADEAPERVRNVVHEILEYGLVLAWDNIHNISYYEIIKKSGKDKNWMPLATKIIENEYCDSEPAKGDNSYRIRAVNDSGPGPWCREYKVVIG
ncbi:MAG: cyclic nucleotide-binding domain-containing protein [Spirochaetales bacterium]|nr:cyclic nucleotide-binding domain-containing protein [Spirochaetales bacterium]